MGGGGGMLGSSAEGERQWERLLRWEPAGGASASAPAWTGPGPWEFLLSMCRRAGAPLPACRLRESVDGRFSGECFLSHLGVRVAPPHAFDSEEAALQNTALLAVLYLRGALNLNLVTDSPVTVCTGSGEDLLIPDS